MRLVLRALIGVVLALPWLPANAEIVAASADHFHIRLQAESTTTPEPLWQKLTQPATWWNSAHTYSGDAQNLSLDPIAGGMWIETWPQGSVWHGTVLQAQPPTTLRLNAPFGPLQGLGINVVWTISFEPLEAGTRVHFDILANGTSASGLDTLAAPVEGVFAEALDQLTQTEN